MTRNIERVTFLNPIIDEGPDPWLAYHEGCYYLTCTSGDGIYMRMAHHFADLRSAEPVAIWKDCTPSRCTEIWAPEFYLIDSENGPRWYGYYTASDGVDINHRLHVLESAGTDPMGPYAYVGQLATDPNHEYYGIDGSILRMPDNRLYFIWAGHPGHVLYIAAMSNPWTITGERVRLEADGFGCSEVREGPVTLLRNGKVFLIYSACDTGKPDYKLGMLVADLNEDLLDPAAWKQFPKPVFTRCDENSVYGPGHNHFFTSPDGREDWIVYHAKSTSVYTYEGRSTRAQPFTWNPEGYPDFGVPLSLNTPIPVPSGD